MKRTLKIGNGRKNNDVTGNGTPSDYLCDLDAGGKGKIGFCVA